MKRPPRITAFRPLHHHWLRLWFDDGAIMDVDFGPLIAWGPVFETLRSDYAVFQQARVEEGNVVWPGDIGFCPDVLYGRYEPESGTKFERRVIRTGSGSVA
jgi:uncharacterized protein DUF2442